MGGAVSVVCKTLYMRMASKNGGYIGRETVLKSMPNLPHGFNGVHISRFSQIGENCTIYQNVTIGQGKDGAPKIGDNCIIGANAVLIGSIVIGNNVKIGAGAIVVDDIPDNATVICQKAKIIVK